MHVLVPQQVGHLRAVYGRRGSWVSCGASCQPSSVGLIPYPHTCSEVYNPFQCCDNKLELGAPKPDREGGVNPLPIIASDGNYGDWYVVEANCCQPGFFCQCPCGPCKEIVWTITAPKAPDTPIGTIKRVWAGLCKQAFTDADNFVIQFPPGATPYQKATLMGCAFLIDFLLFEKKQNNGNSGGGV